MGINDDKTETPKELLDQSLTDQSVEGSPVEDAQTARLMPRYWVPVAAIGIFLMLAVGVFFVAENQARKTMVGFPNFADSAFDLVDQNGERRVNADFADQPLAVFFGFTYCPDVCPTTLLALASVIDELKAEGVATDQLGIILITVDAERDTPDQLRNYLTLFDMQVTGLTGDEAALSAARTAFGAYSQKIKDDDGDVSYDHSAAVYLYRDDGRFSGTIVFNEPADFIREKLRKLVS